MLLRFAVRNFLSIREEQELLFTSSKLKNDGVDLVDSASLGKNKLVPVIVVYGANASGKSNIVNAIATMRGLVLHSHRVGKPGDKINRTPFILDEESRGDTTNFEIDFEIDGVRYNYGFKVSDLAFEEEWLYSYPLKLQRKLFERKGKEISFGRELKGRNAVIADLTRENSLFLSAAFQNNHEQLSAIARFFKAITIEQDLSLESDQVYSRVAMEYEGSIPSCVIGFLENIGSGIIDYRLKERALSDEEMLLNNALSEAVDGVFKELRPNWQKATNPIEGRDIEFGHRGEGGKTFYLPASAESAGTLRMVIAMPAIFKALSEGGIVIIDELDLSLHTKAAEAVISLFASKETNPKGAQLLATTHDTNLLACRKLRRDQVWLTEKDQYGATELYPLSDFKVRKEDNLEKGYLQGRFGAIPNLEH